MSGVGDAPRDFNEFVRDTRRRVTALERRQTALGAVDLSAYITGGSGINVTGDGTAGDPIVVATVERLGPQAQLITDWNDATETGWWMGNNAANAPSPGTWFLGTVETHTDLWVTQTAYAFTADAAIDTMMFRRSSSDSGGARLWDGWYRVRIAESEQDARYMRTQAAGTKFARGTLNAGANAPAGGGFVVNVTFPVGYFSAAPFFIATIDNGRVTVSINGGSLTAAGVGIRLDNWSPAATGSFPNLFWQAIGVGP